MKIVLPLQWKAHLFHLILSDCIFSSAQLCDFRKIMHLPSFIHQYILKVTWSLFSQPQTLHPQLCWFLYVIWLKFWNIMYKIYWPDSPWHKNGKIKKRIFKSILLVLVSMETLLTWKNSRRRVFSHHLPVLLDFQKWECKQFSLKQNISLSRLFKYLCTMQTKTVFARLFI